MQALSDNGKRLRHNPWFQIILVVIVVAAVSALILWRAGPPNQGFWMNFLRFCVVVLVMGVLFEAMCCLPGQPRRVLTVVILGASVLALLLFLWLFANGGLNAITLVMLIAFLVGLLFLLLLFNTGRGQEP